MYQIIILPKAIDDLSRIDKATAKRIIDKLTWLSENFEIITPIPLVSSFSGFYKLRVGDWRVLYETNREQNIITVHKIGHRKEIYK